MISETCKKLGIPLSHTSKLFYGELVASLTVNIPFKKPDRQKFKKNLCNFYKKLSQFQRNRIDFMWEVLGENDWHYKINETSISFYFEQNDDLDLIVEDLVTNNYEVTKVVAPLNEDHVVFLNKNKNKIIRETLFRGKYRFKVEIDRNYTTQDSITKLLHSMLEGKLTVSDGLWPMPELKIENEWAYYNNTRTLYLAELEDVMLVTFALNEFIIRVEEAVSSEVVSKEVLKDVSNEGSIAEEAY